MIFLKMDLEKIYAKNGDTVVVLPTSETRNIYVIYEINYKSSELNRMLKVICIHYLRYLFIKSSSVL